MIKICREKDSHQERKRRDRKNIKRVGEIERINFKRKKKGRKRRRRREKKWRVITLTQKKKEKGMVAAMIITEITVRKNAHNPGSSPMFAMMREGEKIVS